MFTDGITEAMNESEELFGEERLLAALRSPAETTPQEFIAGVLGDVREFDGGADLPEDIATVACRWRP